MTPADKTPLCVAKCSLDINRTKYNMIRSEIRSVLRWSFIPKSIVIIFPLGSHCIESPEVFLINTDRSTVVQAMCHRSAIARFSCCALAPGFVPRWGWTEELMDICQPARAKMSLRRNKSALLAKGKRDRKGQRERENKQSHFCAEFHLHYGTIKQ